MTKLLVFGLAPLPFENTSKNFGPGIRAWQFIKPLLEKKIEILLIANRIPFIYPADTPPEVHQKFNNFHYIHTDSQKFSNPHWIASMIGEFKPDAILVATIFASPSFDIISDRTPIWMDLFGHVMAEAQAKAYRYNDNKYLNHFWNYEYQAINHGDIFSAVSQAQAHALIGELGLMGRLTSWTTGYQFSHVIPCAMDETKLIHKNQVIRGKEVPDDAFVVLWSGGYNVWTDVETLMAGLEYAMKQNDKLYFVSTGGQIDGHDEITYPSFKKLIQKSEFKNRFVLKGWIPKEHVTDYYFEANLGINIDKFMYEGLLGSKNRVLDWMRAGLPSLIGCLCEISYDFPAKKIAYSYPLGDPQQLGKTLLELSFEPESVKETGQRAFEYGKENLTFKKTTHCFRNWLNDPKFSPDSKKKTNFFLDLAQIKQSSNAAMSNENHIQTLENYIFHLESEIDKKNRALGLAPLDSKKRPEFLNNDLKFNHPNPFASFIVVTWNGFELINECLKSIFQQDYLSYECIVIDNHSTDGTADYIHRNYPQVRLLRNSKNLGFSKGVNQGIHEAKGDAIFVINQDAILTKNWLSIMIKAFSDDDSLGIVGCKILYPGTNTFQHAGGILHPNGLTDHYGANEDDNGQYDLNRDCDYVTGAAFGFKKELVDKIGEFDERFSPAYFEELDFCIRTSRAGFHVRYIADAICYHHESTSSVKFSPRFYYLYHKNRLKFISKHYTFRYLIGIFRRFETNWIKNHLPREQLIPLGKAYLVNVPTLVYVAIRDLYRRLTRFK